jgi:hypothetical protein
MTGATYGWGRLTRRLAGLPNGTWPVSSALGLACVIFLGGILNLCRLAFPAALAAIVLTGWRWPFSPSDRTVSRNQGFRIGAAGGGWRCKALW